MDKNLKDVLAQAAVAALLDMGEKLTSVKGPHTLRDCHRELITGDLARMGPVDNIPVVQDIQSSDRQINLLMEPQKCREGGGLGLGVSPAFLGTGAGIENSPSPAWTRRSDYPCPPALIK